MSTEFSSGLKLKEGDRIKGYDILKAFDPGAFAFASKARSPSGRIVFFKKYKRPGGSSPWLAGYVAYQMELKRRVQSDPPARNLCYEFIEFFEMKKTGGTIPLSAFYQVFEWVDGGKSLRDALDELRTNPAAFSWNQQVIFARVMLAGINAIHRIGVIHTDLKPENLYLLPEPAIAAKYKLRVIDMDFSLLEGRSAPWHGSEGYVGTPGYMSPEHIAGQVPNKASDVFTLGLMLGEILGGAHPAAHAMDDYEDLIKNGRLKPVIVRNPIEGVSDPDFLGHVINSCLRPEASKRPTAEQVLMALNGRLAEWDGKRPKTNSAAPTTEIGAMSGSRAESAAPSRSETVSSPSVAVPEPSVAHAAVSATVTSPSSGSAAGVELVGPAGQKLKASIPTKFGRTVLKAWGPDYEKFMSPEQFHVFRNASGAWMIEHCSTATNATNADGVAITAAIPVHDGMVVTLGKTGKCPVRLDLGV